MRTPELAAAKREMAGLTAYGAAAFLVGSFFGIGSHLHGAVFGPTHEVVPAEVLTWAAYNFVFFAAVPYLVFRRHGYGHQAPRTRNAWVHLWAYHAIAPRVTVDTGLIVQVFGIQ